MKFPKHVGLSIEHNEHKIVYCKLDTYLRNIDVDEDDFISDDDYEKCLRNDDIWSVTYYPDTPVGSITVYGSNLDEIVNYINEDDFYDS